MSVSVSSSSLTTRRCLRLCWGLWSVGGANGDGLHPRSYGIFDFDKEGMLVEDFDRMGSMVTIYNPPYYPEHLEALGYEKEVDWLQVSVEVPKDVPAKYARVAELSKEMFGLRSRKLTRTDISRRGYGRKVFDLLNVSYSPLFGYTELSDRQIDTYLKRYLPCWIYGCCRWWRMKEANWWAWPLRCPACRMPCVNRKGVCGRWDGSGCYVR